MFLRRWLDDEREPLPVSVNISRYDVFREDFFDTLTGLVERYRIPLELMRLEITESAFTKSTEVIIAAVKRLGDYGFIIEIDDFGSGSSSLNTLKDVPANILKLDMRFLENKDNSTRGGNILESVIRMAKWLGMPVIAEGVETMEQADYLRSIGCMYIQGYLYAKPMPAADYIRLYEHSEGEQTLSSLQTVENLDNNAFWDPRSMETLIFNSYVGGACIFEFHDGRIELLRVNEKYARELGGDISMEDALSVDLASYMDSGSVKRLLGCIREAGSTGVEACCDVRLTDLPGTPGHTYASLTMRVIARSDSRLLLYCSILNTTAHREAEERVRSMAGQLEAIMNNINGGVTAITVEDDGSIRFIFANERFYSQIGYTKEQFDAEVGSIFDLAHPDDRERVRLRTLRASKAVKPYSISYRTYRRDRSLIWIQCNISFTTIAGVDKPIQIAVSTDITPQVAAEERLRGFLEGKPGAEGADGKPQLDFRDMLTVALGAMMAASTDLCFVKDSELVYICCSKAFANMVGLASEREIVGKTDYDLFERALAEKYRADDLKLIKSGQSLVDYEERIPSEDGSMHYSTTSKYLLNDAHGNVVGLYGIGRDTTESREAYAQLKLLTNNIPGGLAMYEVSAKGLRILYFSDGYYTLTGYTKEEYQAMAGQSTVALVFPEDIPTIRASISSVLHGADSFEHMYRAHCKGGGYKWLNLRGTVLERREGGVVIVNAVKFDVTERMRIEEHLRMSEEQYRLALENSGSIIARYDLCDHSVNMTPNVAAVFDTPQKVTNVPQGPIASGNISPETVDAYARFYQEIESGRKSGEALFCSMTVNGWRWLKARFTTIFSDEGAPVSAVIVLEDVTDALDESAAHRESELVLRLVAEHSNRIIYRYDIATRLIHADRRVAAEDVPLSLDMTTPEELIRSGVVLQESAEDFTRVFEQIDKGVRTGDTKARVRANDGDPRWVDLKYSVIYADDLTPKSAVLSLLDITESHEKELAYERYLQSIDQQAAGEGVLLYMETDVTDDTAEKRGGVELPIALPEVGSSREKIVEYIAQAYLPREERKRCLTFFSREHLIAAYTGGARSLSEEWSVTLPSGKPGYVRSELQMVQDPYTGHIKMYTILRDITSEKREALDIRAKAERDGMTGLYNKTTTEALIRERLKAKDGHSCALLLADLDNLKAINDSHGHIHGDSAIRLIGQALKAHFRQTDIIGRVGGDEFVVFLDNCGNEEWLGGAIGTLMKRLSDVRVGDQGRLPLRGSIGVAMGVAGTDGYDELFKRADRALYHVKRNGKNDFAFYSPDMEKEAYEHKLRHEADMWRDDLFSKDELNRLLSAVATIYPLVVSVNLTKNRYYLMQYENYFTHSQVSSGVFDELIDEGAQSFHPDDRQGFIDAFCRENLLAAHARGVRVVSHEGRQLGDDGEYRKVHTDVIFVKNSDDGDILEIALGREVGI